MESLESTIQGFSGDGSKSPPLPVLMIGVSWQREVPGTASDLLGPPAANRHRLQDERSAITHHFAFGGHEGYLTIGFYLNGQPDEIFFRMAKDGSTIASLMECFGTVVSVSLKHGVPLKVLCDKLSHTRFAPSGSTGNAEIGFVKSGTDHTILLTRTAIPRRKTISLFGQGNGGISAGGKLTPGPVDGSQFLYDSGDAPTCVACGGLMKPSGTCCTCVNHVQISGCYRTP